MTPPTFLDLRTVLGDPEREALCLEFHEDVYLEAFPVADEAEGPDTWLPLLDPGRPIPPPAPILHLIVARDGRGRVAGGHIAEYFRESGVALGTYVAVRPDARRGGLARALLARGIEAVTADAREGGRPAPIVLWEVEDPSLAPIGPGSIDPWTRLRAIASLGFRRVDTPYVQPPLGPGKRPADWLWLVVHESTLGPDAAVPASTLLAFLHEFHRALGFDPSRVDGYLAVERALAGRREIPVFELPRSP